MARYVNLDNLLAEIERLRGVQPLDTFQPKEQNKIDWLAGKLFTITNLEVFLDTLEVKDPYEQCVQYDSIKAGIQAHAETYSFNIESKLFNQLTKEQQKLWRKEIEQAVISGGEAGVELVKDQRYKENLEVKEMQKEPVSDSLEEELDKYIHDNFTIEKDQLDKFGIKEKDYMYSMDKGDMLAMVRHFAKWQKLKDMGITNNAKGVVTNILNSSDKSLDIYATEVAFIMLPANLTENYHMTNRDRISDAVRLGAKWQEAKDESTTEDLGEYINELSKQFPEVSFAKLSRIAVRVANWQKEQMMARAVDAELDDVCGFLTISIPYHNGIAGDKVKVIIIKSE